MATLNYRAISLHQPWASLIASGAKTLETRTWQPYGLRIGQRILIHAAKRWDDEGRMAAFLQPRIYEALGAAEVKGLWDFEDPPLGCFVAVAQFKDCYSTDDRDFPTQEYAFGNLAEGRYAWHFDAVWPIKPIPYRGRQGLFWASIDEEQLRFPRSQP